MRDLNPPFSSSPFKPLIGTIHHHLRKNMTEGFSLRQTIVSKEGAHASDLSNFKKNFSTVNMSIVIETTPLPCNH